MYSYMYIYKYEYKCLWSKEIDVKDLPVLPLITHYERHKWGGEYNIPRRLT